MQPTTLVLALFLQSWPSMIWSVETTLRLQQTAESQRSPLRRTFPLHGRHVPIAETRRMQDDGRSNTRRFSMYLMYTTRKSYDLQRFKLDTCSQSSGRREWNVWPFWKFTTPTKMSFYGTAWLIQHLQITFSQLDSIDFKADERNYSAHGDRREVC